MAEKRRPALREMFVFVNLYTREGELVAARPSLTYVTRPEILIWGERLFTWNPQHEQYREGLGAVLILEPHQAAQAGNYYDDIQREPTT